MGIFFPTALLGALSLMPYIDVTPSRRYSHRRISLTLAMLPERHMKEVALAREIEEAASKIDLQGARLPPAALDMTGH